MADLKWQWNFRYFTVCLVLPVQACQLTPDEASFCPESSRAPDTLKAAIKKDPPWLNLSTMLKCLSMPETYLEGVLPLVRWGKNVLNSSGWTSSIMHPPLDYSFSSNRKSNHTYPADHCQTLPQTWFFPFLPRRSPLAPAAAEGDEMTLVAALSLLPVLKN